MRYWVVMPAAGTGSRFGGAIPKQYALIRARPVIAWALAPFADEQRFGRVVVALAPDDPHWAACAPRSNNVRRCTGGAQRSESVRNGLAALADVAGPDDWVLVHDAARPCVSTQEIDGLIVQVGDHPVGGLLALPAADTLKRAGATATLELTTVEATVERAGLWRALTPQMFRYRRLCEALDAAHASGHFPTDEAQALEWLGEAPLLVEGSPANIKITTAQDLQLAETLMRGRTHAVKIGSGFDVHAFGPGEWVLLGGIRIPYSQGVVAHSDGDVVLHALCDALLGAAGLGDIGQHFPNDDQRWKGADSSLFVDNVMTMVRARGLRVGNADITVLAESPKLAPHRDAMRNRIAALLGADASQVNVKATTTEKLGFLGRAEGLAAQAVVLLVDG